MKKKFYMIIGLITLTGATISAQKITEGDKDLSFLKGENKFNLSYNYDDMTVGKRTEDEYKKEKIAKGNEKQSGKGDRWAEKWVNNRSTVYEPMFEELINKMLAKGKTVSSAAPNQKDAKYTILVKTVMTEPGFNIGVMKQNPYCKFEISWIETASGKVLAKGLLTTQGVLMGGSNWDFDPTNTIKECYAKAGKVVGATMAKKMK